MKEMVYSRNHQQEILDEGDYFGVHYVILNLGTHPTAYIENIFGINDIWSEDIDCPVHGGFTYEGAPYWRKEDSGQFWIGWDYAHCWDYMGYYDTDDTSTYLKSLKKWTTEEIQQEVKGIIKWMVNKYGIEH